MDRVAAGLAWLILLSSVPAVAQTQVFTFDGVGLQSDFKSVAARFPHSVPRDQYVSLAPEDVHDHISSIEVSGTGMTRRVVVGFETRPDGRRNDYPACAKVEQTLVQRYGRPTSIDRFMEEASPRADRVWRSATETMRLRCFKGPRGRFLAEAVQINPR